MTQRADTQCVHAGQIDDPQGGVNTPLSLSSAYGYQSADDVLYPRYYNTPNHQAVAEKLATLEAAESGLALASGLAAISNVLLAHLVPGDAVLITQGCYGGTQSLMSAELPRLGARLNECAMDIDAIAQAITLDTKIIYLETPSNPLLEVIDLAAVAQLARKHQILTVVDNTFATPINQQPLSLGIDIVVHSGTKYLAGHSDLSAGLVACSESLMAPIRQAAVRYGACLNGLDLWLLERSMKTLAIRVERQSQNALALAQALQNNPAVEAVFYPGLETHPQHAIAQQQMHAYGGMLSFRLSKSTDPDLFEQNLNLIRRAVSLGGVETLCCRPLYTSHAKVPANERDRLGIDEQLIRLSVGIENSEDLLGDLRQALYAASP